MSSTRSRSIGERIGADYGWLAGQFALLSVVGIGAPMSRWLLGRLPVPWSGIVDAVAGGILIAGGLVVADQARRDLGDSLRVAPSPLEDAVLVEQGWYGRVRHPLYLAVLLGAAGWGVIWMSIAGIALLPALLVFFLAKSRHEERMLMARYEGYSDYMKRVRSRFVPTVW